MLPITDAVYSSYQHPRDKSVFRSAREYIHQSDFKSILDVGCATGDFLLLLNSPNHYSLSGVDVSSQLIDIARKRLPTSVSLTTCDFLIKKTILIKIFFMMSLHASPFLAIFLLSKTS